MANGILIIGLLLIFAAAEMTIRGAVGLARQFDVPPLFTGILVIASVTVLPELFVTYHAAAIGHPEMALGGLIGTNLLNLLLIMGLGALIHPMASPPKVVFRDGGMLVLGCLGLVFCALTGEVSRFAGVLFLLGFAAYLTLVFFTDWRRAPEHSVPQARTLLRSEGKMPSLTGSAFLFLLGLIALGLGAHLSVLGSIHLAARLGWGEATVGLIFLAVGLSLPKLLVALVSAVRAQTTIAVGQLLGAGVFNLFAVLGLVAVIRPFAFPQNLASGDVLVLTAASIALLPLLAMRWRLSRPRGVLLMVAYGCYLAFLLWRQGLPLPWGP